MILGIGIDSVEIKRFIPCTEYSQEKLLRIFSEQEIAYSKAVPRKTAERLAARWAAKEAFFKALAQMAPGNKIPLLTLCKLISVQSSPGKTPYQDINWPQIAQRCSITPTKTPHCMLSITHTSTTATAIIILEK